MEKTLIEKFIDNEITEETFEAERAKLSPEEQEKLKKEAEAKAPDAVKKLIDIRRGIDKIAKKEEGGKDFGEQFRNEQLEKAKSTFFTKFGIEKDEDKKSFEEGFKKFDSGKVDAENIIKDMNKYYASEHAEEYLEIVETKKKAEQMAEEENANNAGTNGSGQGGGGSPKISKEAKALMDASAKQGKPITAEFAERAIKIAKQGGKFS